jgi:hypothetical protein
MCVIAVENLHKHLGNDRQDKRCLTRKGLIECE